MRVNEKYYHIRNRLAKDQQIAINRLRHRHIAEYEAKGLKFGDDLQLDIKLSKEHHALDKRISDREKDFQKHHKANDMDGFIEKLDRTSDPYGIKQIDKEDGKMIGEPSLEFLNAFNKGYDLQRLSPSTLKKLESIDLPKDIKEAIVEGAKAYREQPVDQSKFYADPDNWEKMRKDITQPSKDKGKNKDKDKDKG